MSPNRALTRGIIFGDSGKTSATFFTLPNASGDSRDIHLFLRANKLHSTILLQPTAFALSLIHI